MLELFWAMKKQIFLVIVFFIILSSTLTLVQFTSGWDFLGYAKYIRDSFGQTNSEVGIFLGRQYEPLSDPQTPASPTSEFFWSESEPENLHWGGDLCGTPTPPPPFLSIKTQMSEPCAMQNQRFQPSRFNRKPVFRDHFRPPVFASKPPVFCFP